MTAASPNGRGKAGGGGGGYFYYFQSFGPSRERHLVCTETIGSPVELYPRCRVLEDGEVDRNLIFHPGSSEGRIRTKPNSSKQQDGDVPSVEFMQYSLLCLLACQKRVVLDDKNRRRNLKQE